MGPLSFLELFVLIILTWVLIDLWSTFAENLAFRTCGLDRTSTFQTLVLAVTATAIIGCTVFFVNTASSGAVDILNTIGAPPDITGSVNVTEVGPSTNAITGAVAGMNVGLRNDIIYAGRKMLGLEGTPAPVATQAENPVRLFEPLHLDFGNRYTRKRK